jgi:hypothetical protein
MPDQIVCEACGHANSTNRQTCKNCRATLAGTSAIPMVGLPIAVSIKYSDPSQQTAVLQKVAADVMKILTPNEELLYIALQNMAALSVRKDSVVATNNRLILYRPGVLGRISFEDFQWQDVKNAKINQGFVSSTVSVETTQGRKVVMGGLDKEQAKRLYSLVQQLEQEWREKRRVREMEEDRAKAGGIQFGAGLFPSAAAPAAPDDPVQRLAKAKTMLDQGLISETEYDTVKAKILAAM